MIKILCVDDEEDIREEIVEELEDAGFETVEAGNGEEALAMVLEHNPALIICDITMPKMNGYEFVAELRENHPEHCGIPCLFLSALSEREDMVVGLKVGADAYLTKPVDFGLLLANVDAKLREVDRMHEGGDGEDDAAPAAPGSEDDAEAGAAADAPADEFAGQA